MDLLNPREATYDERVANAEDEPLSDAWLDLNLFNAESVPDDYRFEITGKLWFDMLMEIHLARKKEKGENNA